ncbi:hypothetical protein COU54_04390 [Candidatus Pacearchaeota archaeon CG10_big_fil_rev_8_21_14_0_10_31_24]|nr:MAG: hypothetical protein COU54_04390 [Candidatus Pacearchaeota archaeon CG10_big_fil_rev_8_21_14_0_10_31_24]
MIFDYLVLAFKNLKKKGIRSWLTLLGIIIGIAAVVALISLGQSLEMAVTGQFSSIAADRLVISSTETGFGPPGSTAVRQLTESDVRLIESVQGVREVIPRLIRITKVEYNKDTEFEYVASIPENKEGRDFIYETFQFEAELGRLLKEEDSGKVFLGSSLKEDHGFEKGIQVGATLNIQNQNFEVIGILKPLSNIQFNHAIYMSEKDLKNILNIGNELDLIIAKIESPNKAEEISEAITRKLRKDRNQKEGEEDFSVETPLQAVSSINSILSAINIVITGIAAISILIGAIGVANAMFTSVIERTREIGVMKAIGAENKDILILFLIESSFLGLAGGVLGAILGLGMAFIASIGANLFFDSQIFNVDPSPYLLGGAILFSSILGILAGTIPAYQASRLHPVEALRR